MCLNRDFCFFWVSSLAYPNLLGAKGYVVFVVVDHVYICEDYSPSSFFDDEFFTLFSPLFYYHPIQMYPAMALVFI